MSPSSKVNRNLSSLGDVEFEDVLLKTSSSTCGDIAVEQQVDTTMWTEEGTRVNGSSSAGNNDCGRRVIEMVLDGHPNGMNTYPDSSSHHFNERGELMLRIGTVEWFEKTATQ